MKYRADYSKSPLLFVDILEVDDSDLQKKMPSIYLKGIFSTNFKKEIKYRLYKRYYDINLDRVLDTLTTMDERNEHESVFMNLLKDPNEWALTGEVEQFKKIKLQISPSQEEISKKILERDFKLVLVKHISFRCLPHADDSKKNHFNGIKKCRAWSLWNKIGINDKPTVIGSTVCDWFKVRKSWNSGWVGCDIMIIDEGSQLLVSDASIAIECLNPKTGKLIVVRDHMQFGPILQATYPTFSLNHFLIFGSILQCLMRKENGNVIHEENLILREEQKHNFGPLTAQLKENWKMNEKSNSFFQMIYGKDYKISPLKETKLLPSLLFEDPDSRIKRILSPDSAIILVKLMARNKGLRNNPRTLEDKFLQTEVEVVEKIYISINNVEETKKQSLLVVTPSHRQRIAIQLKLKRYPNINLQIIDTTEKMQGKETDIVIACFGFYNLDKTSKKEFVFKINRWNVATSRARSKVIIITTDKMLDPEDIEISTNKKMREGRAFLNMIENWVQNNDNNIGEKIKRENIGIIKWTISGDEKKQRND
ncbi:AAA family ATPase [Rhizophagus irregularis DAOM 181602=DAOM 197198]|nr:AAA family ATPase [Rhizophagus irregularis DAOM 181602=DAOM 197198]